MPAMPLGPVRLLTLALVASLLLAGCAATPPAPRLDPSQVCDPDCASAPLPAEPADPACEPSSAVDRDGDGVLDDCDPDTSDGPKGDADGDGVPNKDDACPGHDDAIDADSDGKIDGCDDDPNDGPTGDADGDMVPNEDDQCPGEDDHLDANGDGAPDCQTTDHFVPGTCWRIQQGPEGKYRLAAGVWDPTGPPGTHCDIAAVHTPWTWRTGITPP